jgi:hypothetical protein
LTSGYGPRALIAFSKVPSVPGFKFPARHVRRFRHKTYSSISVRVEALVRSFLAKSFLHRRRHVKASSRDRGLEIHICLPVSPARPATNAASISYRRSLGAHAVRPDYRIIF